jgi:hypothetical protein
LEGNAIYGADDAVVGIEICAQVADVEQRLAGRRRPCGSAIVSRSLVSATISLSRT